MTCHAHRQPTRVVLYRKSDGWRTTVFEANVPDTDRPKLARICISCGGLPEIPAEASFEDAAAEFTEMLRLHWGVTQPINWQELKPGWWGADL